MSADLLTRLIAAGTPAELVADVARLEARAAMAEEEAVRRRDADEARRAHVREGNNERQRRRRGGHAPSRDVTRDGRDVTASFPPDKEHPQTPEKITPLTPTDEADASSLPPLAAGVAARELNGKAEQEAREVRLPAWLDRPKSKRKAARKPGSRLSADWTAPPVEELSLAVQAMIAKWPAGAYQFVAEKFANHWLAEGRAIGAKRCWKRTFENWLMGDAGKVAAMVKAGFDFSPWAPGAAKGAAGIAVPLPAAFLAGQKREGEAARAVRAALLRDCGERTYGGWLKPTVFLVEGDTVTICATSQFIADWIGENFRAQLTHEFTKALGRRIVVKARVGLPEAAESGTADAEREEAA